MFTKANQLYAFDVSGSWLPWLQFWGQVGQQQLLVPTVIIPKLRDGRGFLGRGFVGFLRRKFMKIPQVPWVPPGMISQPQELAQVDTKL